MMFEQGSYRGRIKNYGLGRSQVGMQHPEVYVEFDVTGRYDPSSGQVVPCQAGTRTYSKAVTPKTIAWLLADLKAIGYDKPSLSYLDPETPGAVNLYDREIDVDCEHESYEGQVHERWSIHRETTREKLRRDELRALDAQYADAFKRILGAGKPTVAPPVSQMNNDDPF